MELRASLYLWMWLEVDCETRFLVEAYQLPFLCYMYIRCYIYTVKFSGVPRGRVLESDCFAFGGGKLVQAGGEGVVVVCDEV